jgi:hypothetical protein
VNVLTAQSAIVETHLGFIDKLGKRLRDEPHGCLGTPGGVLMEQLPGLQSLFDSIVCASETPRRVIERHIEDWNPLSQRILLSDERPLPSSVLETEFSLIPSYVQTFIEWAHEAVHIFAMEPWFCGRKALDSKEKFVQWYLGGEGLAYWYADIVVTRAVRDAIPEAELVYNRSAVSNAGFHPEQAFRSLGINDTYATLPLYINGFVGQDIRLKQSDNPLCITLAEKIYEFYTKSTITLHSLYTVLEESGIFEEFYQRFCQVDNLPGLFDEAQLDALATLDIEDYLLRIGSELLPVLEDLAPERIQLIAARRHIQTRAYYAWILLVAIKKGSVLGNEGFSPDTITSGLTRYLNKLEQLLKAVSAGEQVNSILHELSINDAVYESEVRTPLKACYAHMKHRYFIFPFFAPTGGLVGIGDARSGFSLDEMDAVIRYAFGRTTLTAEIVHLLDAFMQAYQAYDEAKATAAFNRFMTHPGVISAWSVSLGDISPANNKFREILFEYH